LVVTVVVLFHGADATQPLDLTPTSVATPNADATVDPNVLVGLSTQRASDVLKKAGFVVAINPVEAAGVPAGTVTGVQPSGQVPPGATVTLDVSKGAVASTPTTASTSTTVAPPPERKKKGHGKP
jgi:serine/threonine-protein kinase